MAYSHNPSELPELHQLRLAKFTINDMSETVVTAARSREELARLKLNVALPYSCFNPDVARLARALKDIDPDTGMLATISSDIANKMRKLPDNMRLIREAQRLDALSQSGMLSNAAFVEHLLSDMYDVAVQLNLLWTRLSCLEGVISSLVTPLHIQVRRCKRAYNDAIRLHYLVGFRAERKARVQLGFDPRPAEKRKACLTGVDFAGRRLRARTTGTLPEEEELEETG
jgi:hypothetical protein